MIALAHVARQNGAGRPGAPLGRPALIALVAVVVSAGACQGCRGRGGDGRARPDAGCPAGESGPVELDTGRGVLAGTLRLPAGCPPHPLAVIVAGSGPTDRDGNSALLPGHNDSLKMLAEALAGRGIASVRYDKRGIAASKDAMPASEHDYRFSMLVEDAAAWGKRFAADPRFSSLIVIGHSEGSLIGMLAAAKAGAKGFVSIAGSGRPAGDLLRAQLAAQLSGDLLAKANHIIAELEAGREVESPPPALMALFRKSVQPYLIEWFGFDPARELSDLNLPALVVQGTTDLQVTIEDARLLAADRPTTEVLLVPGMNHVLKHVSGDLSAQAPSYGDPALPIEPAVPEAIAAYVARIGR